jgi:hypothetical protein
MSPAQPLTRRTMLTGGAALGGAAFAGAGAARADTLLPPAGRLSFEVWRNGRRIGAHSLTFRGDDADFSVAVDAAMVVGLGPVVLFRYHHQATETWQGGRFASLQSQSITNGRHEQVLASRTAGGVLVKTGAGAQTLPQTALPLTHWNQHGLQGPLFNPQTGAPMRESAARQPGQSLRLADGRAIPATRYALTGDAQIVDWYDAAGAWVALRAKAVDGSEIDYRRMA